MSTFPGMFRARRAVVAAPDEDEDEDEDEPDDNTPDDAATAAMIDALEALSVNDPKKAASILAAAIKGTYVPEDDGKIPPVKDMQAEGIPAALATEIGDQAKTDPRLARNSLKHARARLGTTTNVHAPPSGARARVGRNPWLPFGGGEGAA